MHTLSRRFERRFGGKHIIDTDRFMDHIGVNERNSVKTEFLLANVHFYHSDIVCPSAAFYHARVQNSALR